MTSFRVKAWLALNHVPATIIALVTLVVAQISVNLAPGWLTISGNPVDLSSSAGRTGAALLVLGILARIIQNKLAAPAAGA